MSSLLWILHRNEVFVFHIVTTLSLIRFHVNECKLDNTANYLFNYKCN